MGRKAQEVLWRGGGYRVAPGDSWVLGAWSSWPQRVQAQCLVLRGREEGAPIHGDALVAGRDCPGVAALAFQGTDVSTETFMKREADAFSPQPAIPEQDY